MASDVAQVRLLKSARPGKGKGSARRVFFKVGELNEGVIDGFLARLGGGMAGRETAGGGCVYFDMTAGDHEEVGVEEVGHVNVDGLANAAGFLDDVCPVDEVGRVNEYAGGRVSAVGVVSDICPVVDVGRAYFVGLVDDVEAVLAAQEGGFLQCLIDCADQDVAGMVGEKVCGFVPRCADALSGVDLARPLEPDAELDPAPECVAVGYGGCVVSPAGLGTAVGLVIDDYLGRAVCFENGHGIEGVAGIAAAVDRCQARGAPAHGGLVSALALGVDLVNVMGVMNEIDFVDGIGFDCEDGLEYTKGLVCTVGLVIEDGLAIGLEDAAKVKHGGVANAVCFSCAVATACSSGECSGVLHACALKASSARPCVSCVCAAAAPVLSGAKAVPGCDAVAFLPDTADTGELVSCVQKMNFDLKNFQSIEVVQDCVEEGIQGIVEDVAKVGAPLPVAHAEVCPAADGEMFVTSALKETECGVGGARAHLWAGGSFGAKDATSAAACVSGIVVGFPQGAAGDDAFDSLAATSAVAFDSGSFGAKAATSAAACVSDTVVGFLDRPGAAGDSEALSSFLEKAAVIVVEAAFQAVEKVAEVVDEFDTVSVKAVEVVEKIAEVFNEVDTVLDKAADLFDTVEALAFLQESVLPVVRDIDRPVAPEDSVALASYEEARIGCGLELDTEELDEGLECAVGLAIDKGSEDTVRDLDTCEEAFVGKSKGARRRARARATDDAWQLAALLLEGGHCRAQALAAGCWEVRLLELEGRVQQALLKDKLRIAKREARAAREAYL
jgi:hypothetical protein